MKISIIIPVYNSQKTLEKLIGTILSQTFENYEVILVNDGSTDDSWKIIQSIAKKDKRIRIFNKKNEGPGLTRKFGFCKAEGELLFFIDSDDWLYNNKALERIADTYNNNKFEILFFDLLRICNKSTNRTNAFMDNELETGEYRIEMLKERVVGGALWQKVFVKDKMKEQYFYDSGNYEDYYTTYMYLDSCTTFYYVKDIIYVADRDNPNSTTKEKSIKKRIDAVTIINSIYANTKFKNSIAKLGLYEFIANWRLAKKIFRLSKEYKILIENLKKTKVNIIQNRDLKELTFVNKIKYLVTNVALKVGGIKRYE